EVVSLRVRGRLLGDDFFFLRRKCNLERFGDAQGDFFLDGEDVFHLPVVALGPNGMTRGAFHELRGDAKPRAGPTNGAFEHVHGSQFFADLRRGDRLVAEGEHLGAWIDFEASDFRQLGDDVFGHSVAKVLVFFRAAEIFEVEDRYGFFLWAKRGGGYRRNSRVGAAAGRVETSGRVDVALQALQIGAELRCRLTAKIAIFFQGFGDEAVELRPRFGVPPGNGIGRVVQDVVENYGGGVSFERENAGRHFIKDDAE